MKVDNFDIISRILDYQSEYDFYYLQIIKRRKDNPDLPRNEKLIRNYYLKEGDLEKYKESIINTCELNNARAYIRLNKRNYKDLTYQMNVKLAKYLQENQYEACENLFNSVCGQYHSSSNKKWLLDLDYKDKSSINWWKEKLSNNFIIEIPTLNGYHIITTPFNIEEFKKSYYYFATMPEIHKDNPTLLYF
jgi:hypothetical protein